MIVDIGDFIGELAYERYMEEVKYLRKGLRMQVNNDLLEYNGEDWVMLENEPNEGEL